MTDQRDKLNKSSLGGEEVPESWRGYLSDKPSPGRPDAFRQPDARRDEWERDRKRAEERAAPRTVVSAGQSASEGVSFAGLVPFFAALAIALFGATWYIWSSQIKPRPYDIAALGPADKQPEEVARDLFREMAEPSPNLGDVLLPPLEIGKIPNGASDPRVNIKEYANRAQRMAKEVPTGDYVAVNPPPKPDPSNPFIMLQEYERTDKATGQKTNVTLVLARAKAGWRVTGFE